MSFHHRHAAISIALIAFMTFMAASCSGGYYIKKPFPDTRYGQAVENGLLISSSGIRIVGSEKRVVYRQWRFMGADSENVLIQYEEHYDSLKAAPDITEELTIPIKEDKIIFSGYVIEIYELKATSMSYYVIMEER